MRLFRSLRWAIVGAALSALGWGCAPYQNATVPPPGVVLAPPAAPMVPVTPPMQAEPVAPIVREIPPPMRLQDRVAILVQPEETIAPIRSEVILIASVLGSDGYLRTNEPVHWHLDPNGVGQIVDVCPGTITDWLVGDFTRPRKVSNNYAVTSTSRRYLHLTRGTVNPDDDVSIMAGQTWISVTSAVEGTSVITAFAPGVRDWSRRIQTAKVYWVDAEWSNPSPAIVPAGSPHQLVTTLTRQSDRAPLAGWIVRYSIRSGPTARFLPSGASATEVTTNELGQAAVEISQDQPIPGTSLIATEIINPQVLDSTGRPIVVGRATTHVTWSSPGLSLRKMAPAQVAVGGSLQYRIEVANFGDLPAADVVVTDRLPPGLTFQKSIPEPTEPFGVERQLKWSLGALASNESRVIVVECIAERAGRIENTATATGHGGLQATSTAVTEVGVPTLQLRLRGPGTALVGDTVKFSIELTNRGTTPLPGLVLRARFDTGLRHAAAPSPIERDLGQALQPGETQQIGVEFVAVQSGRHCVEIQVLSGTSVLASSQECVQIQPAAGPTAPGQPPGQAPSVGQITPGTGLIPPTPLQLRVLGPQLAQVGEMVEFVIELANSGTKPVEGIQLSCKLDPELVPKFASGGFEPRRPGEPVAPFVWRRDSIASNQTVQYRLQCVAQKSTPSACLTVEAMTADGARLSEKRCVTLQEGRGSLGPEPSGGLPPPGPTGVIGSLQTGAAIPPPATEAKDSPIQVRARLLREEVSVGQRTTLLVQLVNTGSVPVTQVRLQVRLPPEVQRIKFGTFGPPGAEDPMFQDSLVQFPALTHMAPGSSAEYRVAVQALKPATCELQVEVSFVGRATPQTFKVPLVITSAP